MFKVIDPFWPKLILILFGSVSLSTAKKHLPSIPGVLHAESIREEKNAVRGPGYLQITINSNNNNKF
jgi:hypothetical protein